MKNGRLEPSDHGRMFSAIICGGYVEGRVSYEPYNARNDIGFHLCQNKCSGFNSADNKFGYNYSWFVYDGTEKRMIQEDLGVTNLKILGMTKSEIENYKDFKKGDVLKRVGGEVIKIIEQIGTILFAQFASGSVSCYTAEYLYYIDYRLDVEPEEEEKPIVELSIAEIAKKLGLSPEQLKVVDK